VTHSNTNLPPASVLISVYAGIVSEDTALALKRDTTTVNDDDDFAYQLQLQTAELFNNGNNNNNNDDDDDDGMDVSGSEQSDISSVENDDNDVEMKTVKKRHKRSASTGSPLKTEKTKEKSLNLVSKT